MFKRRRSRLEAKHDHGSPDLQRRVVVDHNLCFFCGACVAVCPPDSIFLENAHLTIDHETCTLCERCPSMCPVHALSIVELAGSAEGGLQA